MDRIRKSVDQYGDRFLDRVFTAGERSYSLSKANWAERFAARFAAKEAGMKAVGTGWQRGVTWKDFEVMHVEGGRPERRLSGVAAQVATELGVRKVSLSMSHTSATAIAVVILEDGR